MGSPSLGWGIQESPDEFLDPPATVDNVRTTAFASHPSRPYFLVGSGNTNIYLWEFGKDTATSTYGVLPAANIPPPYAVASVSAVRFDHCGHRFVTAALDGTVNTWQLEVGGRNNIHPTESSTCLSYVMIESCFELVLIARHVFISDGCMIQDITNKKLISYAKAIMDDMCKGKMTSRGPSCSSLKKGRSTDCFTEVGDQEFNSRVKVFFLSDVGEEMHKTAIHIRRDSGNSILHDILPQKGISTDHEGKYDDRERKYEVPEALNGNSSDSLGTITI